MSKRNGVLDDPEDPDELERRAREIRANRAAREAEEARAVCPTPNERHLYNVADTCHILGNISKQKLYGLIYLKQIRPLKLGSRSMFDIEEIERFINVLRDERAAGGDSVAPD